MSSQYIEQNLPAPTADQHRALSSLQEELEAVDWYNQRASTTQNPELAAILEHNRNEEIEHAAMLLEWLRRNMPAVESVLKTYLFTRAPITELEEAQTGGGDGAAEPTNTPAGETSLGIGKPK